MSLMPYTTNSMPTASSALIWKQKKRRIFGELITEATVRSKASWVAVHRSSKELLLTYESRGLVVSLYGGGELPADHPEIKTAVALATWVAGHDGIVMHGGRGSGIMEAVSVAAGKLCLGVLFSEIRGEAVKQGDNAVVNAPTPRIELLGTCAPVIVIFRGGLGSFQVLMRAIVHVRNRKYHPEQPPQLIFVSDYWIGLLTTMMNLSVLPREFLTELHFFHVLDDITKLIPSNP